MNRTITQLVTLLRTFADELEGHCVEQVASGKTVDQAIAEIQEDTKPRKPRGRPAGTAGTPTPAEPEKEAAADAPEGMKLEDLQALIQPAVKAAAGKQVKDLIAKHGGTQLSNLPPANHAAFAEDVGALVY